MNWKKVALAICVLALLVSACGYGVYRLMLSRYSSEIDSILTDILSDDGLTPPAESPEEPPLVALPPSAGMNITPPQSPASPPAGPVSEPTSSPQEGSGAEPNVEEEFEASVVEEATEGLALTAEEQQRAESADDILERMSTSEKLMVLKTLNRFSVDELLEMYRIYSSGDAEAIAELKKTIKAKFTAEDIELIKQMAAKYR